MYRCFFKACSLDVCWQSNDYIYVHTHNKYHQYIHICIHACMHACIYIYIYTCMYMYRCFFKACSLDLWWQSDDYVRYANVTQNIFLKHIHSFFCDMYVCMYVCMYVRYANFFQRIFLKHIHGFFCDVYVCMCRCRYARLFAVHPWLCLQYLCRHTYMYVCIYIYTHTQQL